jgi:hypothetical protein
MRRFTSNIRKSSINFKSILENHLQSSRGGEAVALMDKLKTFCEQWMRRKTPGMNVEDVFQSPKRRRKK